MTKDTMNPIRVAKKTNKVEQKASCYAVLYVSDALDRNNNDYGIVVATALTRTDAHVMAQPFWDFDKDKQPPFRSPFTVLPLNHVMERGQLVQQDDVFFHTMG